MRLRKQDVLNPISDTLSHWHILCNVMRLPASFMRGLQRQNVCKDRGGVLFWGQITGYISVVPEVSLWGQPGTLHHGSCAAVSPSINTPWDETWKEQKKAAQLFCDPLCKQFFAPYGTRLESGEAVPLSLQELFSVSNTLPPGVLIESNQRKLVPLW